MYDNILETIKSYITEENTDYAILLDGDWGTGKTHFVKNILLSAINKIDFDDSNKFDYVYISAAGINNIEQFINDIYYSITIKKLSNSNDMYNKLYKKLYNNRKIIKSITSIMPEGEKLCQIISDISGVVIKELTFLDIVIIIDDIERISNYLEIDDFLYRIFDNFLPKGIKILFVGNENEIHSNSNDKKSNYYRIKEKVIKHTINIYDIDKNIFVQIINNIFEEIEKEKYKNGKYNFYAYSTINTHKAGLIDIFLKKKCFNIRVFLSYLDLSKKLFDINELKNNYNSFEKILLKLLSILIEIRTNDEDGVNKIHENDKDEEKELFKEIKNYIKTGHLEEKKIIDYYKENIINNYNYLL